ncbi:MULTISPECIES: hypothetical protein [Salinibaculum]|uniref:hypothetical protein n=1 Tax=Salinibaculum TaxID=2732368 RepID=UPI0030D178E4
MDAPVGSLPSRPLRRDEVDRFTEFGSIDGVFPIFDAVAGDGETARGVALAADGRLYALAYRDGEWHEVESAAITPLPEDEDGPSGIHVDDRHTLEELHDEIRAFLGR